MLIFLDKDFLQPLLLMCLKVNFEDNQTAVGYLKNQEYIRMTVGDDEPVVNFVKTKTDVPPLLKDDRLFIPLRFFSEALGADVLWLENQRTVEINVQSIFDMEFSKDKYSLLLGRLHVAMPEKSKLDTSSFNAASQISSPSVLGHQIIVKAKELFQKSSGDLREDVSYLGAFIPSGELLQKDGLQMISYTNNPPNATVQAGQSEDFSSPLYFKRYLLKDRHDMLISLDFLIPSAFWEQAIRPQYEEITNKILDSLTLGERILDTSAHTEAKNNIRVNLLQDYIAQPLPDRGIAIQKVTSITQKAPYIHLYAKPENNEMSLRSDVPTLKLDREANGNLDGNTFIWQIYSDGTMYAEVTDECTGNIVYSLYGFAEQETDQNDMIKIVDSLTFFASAPAKPVIYLYPETETEVSVQLELAGDFTFTYPQYNNGWRVIARPDGTILSEGKEYSYLFWEGVFKAFHTDFKEGFVVKGSDSVEFLQKVLSEMGLTPKEYNEFIVYWAPKMQENEYNKVYFAKEEYEQAAKLTISPKPDSILRVYMVYEKTEKGTVLPPQRIEPFERKGFTVVEWGGQLLSTEQ